MTPILNVSWLPPIFAQASERLAGNLNDLAGGTTVWLAVTGLSRSGKTVFITSLIHNLLSSAHNPNRMPLLNVVGERRLIAASLEGARAHRLPRFPYLGNIEKMAVPDWPSRTADISEIGIEVRFAPAGTLGRLLSEITGNPASLTIRIVGRMAPRPAVAGAKLRRVVARHAASAPQGRARRDHTRFSRLHRTPPTG